MRVTLILVNPRMRVQKDETSYINIYLEETHRAEVIDLTLPLSSAEMLAGMLWKALGVKPAQEEKIEEEEAEQDVDAGSIAHLHFENQLCEESENKNE